MSENPDFDGFNLYILELEAERDEASALYHAALTSMDGQLATHAMELAKVEAERDRYRTEVLTLQAQLAAPVYVVALPNEDIEVFRSYMLAHDHAQDLCTDWVVDWGGLEHLAEQDRLGVLATGTVETPDGVLRIESCVMKS